MTEATCTCTVRPPQREHFVGRSVTGYAIYLSTVTDHTRFDPACPFHGDDGSMRFEIRNPPENHRGADAMRKIPTVLRRNPENMKYVLPEVTPGCEWVLAGEGVPTRKYDGTCVMLDAAGWWARREVKPGKRPPKGFIAVDHDETTGKTVGWEPIEQSGFAKWHADALRNFADQYGTSGSWKYGTYELVGPKVQGDPDRFGRHWLVPHDRAMTLRSIFDLDTPRQLMEFARWAGEEGYEGIVWHHPDGRMAKLKARDVPMDRLASSAPLGETRNTTDDPR